jgi:hypothetical protein
MARPATRARLSAIMSLPFASKTAHGVPHFTVRIAAPTVGQALCTVKSRPGTCCVALRVTRAAGDECDSIPVGAGLYRGHALSAAIGFDQQIRPSRRGPAVAIEGPQCRTLAGTEMVSS